MIASFSLQPNVASLIVSIIAVVMVVVLAYWSWQRSGFHRGINLLELLRVLLVLAAVLLLNQPETVQQFLPTEKPTIVVLGDRSKSMMTRDAGLDAGGERALTTRSEAIDGLMDEATWSDVKDRFNVVVQPFAEGEQSDETDLAGALESARREHANLRGVLLASDGDWNSGPPPVDVATRLRLAQVPIFGVSVGSASRLPDVDLLSFDLPTSGVVGKAVRIPFTIESSLPRDHSVVVTMTSQDGEKVTHDVRISAMGRTTDAILWKPENVGEFALTLSVPEHGDEQITDNNSRTASITIKEEKLKVLVVESLPRWEYRYLRNALSRDPGVEVSCLLFHPKLSKVGGGNRDYIKTFPEALEDLALYDVVFLGDVGIDNGQLTPEQCALLKGLVQQQASGLVFMPGWQGNQLSLAETELAELIPVTLDEGQPEGWGSQAPGHFALTELGRRSLLTKLADTSDENMQVWESLPGFQWYAPIIRAKAGTDVLAVHQDASNEYGRIPLLVTKTSGAGKVLFMGTDGAWRWRRGVEDLYHYRFWGQVVRWMAYRRNMAKGELMRFFYTPEQPKVRQTIALSVNAMEKSGEPLSKGNVTARIVAPSGEAKTVRLQKIGEQWGAFGGAFTPSEPGRHEVTLRCAQTQAVLQTNIDVQGATLERLGKPARPEVLEELARVTRGQVLKSGDVGKIVQAISDIPPPVAQVRRVQLWSHPLVAALMIAMLGLFWVGRKMVGVI
ncbi:hypothetical protein [Stieleria varia]|uniref:Glutamine amidotransferase domain-containing protein n=1 Tax=Stieleria varia TaxID=2528005 RepID=A0A5C6AL68_9BACT|nr:hypothetical protein [Stieleria varia]TWU00775.1 hypothetical protein Pla52n_41440 [Stieleria varia]